MYLCAESSNKFFIQQSDDPWFECVEKPENVGNTFAIYHKDRKDTGKRIE